MKKIITDKKAVFLCNLFNNEGTIKQEVVDVSVVFREGYSREYLSLQNYKPYLFEIFPVQESQNSFPVLLFARSVTEAIRFVANNYHVREIRQIKMQNVWAVLRENDLYKIEKINKKLEIPEEDDD